MRVGTRLTLSGLGPLARTTRLTPRLTSGACVIRFAGNSHRAV
jgi:hypothetical protein